MMEPRAIITPEWVHETVHALTDGRFAAAPKRAYHALWDPRVHRPWGDRLLAKIDKRAACDCWEWTAARYHTRYGMLSHTSLGRNISRPMRAHRLVRWLIDGHTHPMVRHTCDNRPCCNPAHLLPGDHASNTQDAVERGRYVSGTRHPGAVLSEDRVRDARAKYSTGNWTQRQLASAFGTSLATMNHALRGKNWSQVR